MTAKIVKEWLGEKGELKVPEYVYTSKEGDDYYMVEGSQSVLSPEYTMEIKYKGVSYTSVLSIMESSLPQKNKDKLIERTLREHFESNHDIMSVLLNTGGVPIVYAGENTEYGIGISLTENKHTPTNLEPTRWLGEGKYTKLLGELYIRYNKGE